MEVTGHHVEHVEYKVYSSRWTMLALFCFLNAANAMMWVTFAPITDLTQDYFGGASLTTVNMLALVFQIGYLPGTFVGVLCSKKYGIRKTLLIGGALDLFGSLVRVVAAVFRDSLGVTGSYVIMMIGQISGSLAQPIFVNLPAAIAADWFSIDERDVATTIASLFNPLGSAIGQVIPPMTVTSDDNGGDVHGMTSLLIIEAGICGLSLLLAFLWFKSKPPTPPSRSALIKHKAQSKTMDSVHGPVHLPSSVQSLVEIDADAVQAEMQEEQEEEKHNKDNLSSPQEEHSGHQLSGVSLNNSSSRSRSISRGGRELSLASVAEDISYLEDNLTVLFANKNYVLLFAAFSIALGLFNAFLTLIYQIIEPHGYSNDDAGTFAAILILCGLIGAGVASVILDTTHMYREVLKFGFVMCTFAMIFFACMLYANNFALLGLAFGILGLFMLPILPAVVENCAETTYPIQEDLPLGLLMIGGNLIGIPFVIVLQSLLRQEAYGPAPFLPSNVFILSLVVITTLMLTQYNGDYKRLQCESKRSDTSHGGGTGTLGTNTLDADFEGFGGKSSHQVTDPLITRITSTHDSSNHDSGSHAGAALSQSTSAIDQDLLRTSRSTTSGLPGVARITSQNN